MLRACGAERLEPAALLGGETILGWVFGRCSEEPALSQLHSFPRGGTVTEAFPYGTVGGKASARHCLRRVPDGALGARHRSGLAAAQVGARSALAAQRSVSSPVPACPQPRQQKVASVTPWLQTLVPRCLDTSLDLPKRTASRSLGTSSFSAF